MLNGITETINVGLDFEITNWKDDQFLDVKVLVNDVIIYENNQTQGSIEVRAEDIEIFEDANHTLKVIVAGMKMDYTKIDIDGEIVDDVLLKIKNVYLDEIPLDNLVYEKCEYLPEYPAGVAGERVLPRVEHLGWNGTWRLEFTSPVYLWLLENM